MSQQDSEKAPIIFHDVAVYFSEKEWKLLYRWQKERYVNVMKEIHQALISLGYQIVSPKTFFRISKGKDGFFYDAQEMERRADTLDPALACCPDILLRIQHEEPLHCEDRNNSEETKNTGNPSTDNPVITSVYSLSHGLEEGLNFQELEPDGENTAGPVITSVYSLPQEETPLQENLETEGTNTDDPVITSVFSLCQGHEKEMDLLEPEGNSTAGPFITSFFSQQYLEETPYQEPPEKSTGDGSMNRNRKGDSIKCSKKTSFSAKVIQSTEKGKISGNQPLSEPNKESVSSNPVHYKLNEGTLKAEKLDKRTAIESNLKHAKLPTFISNTQHYASAECGENFREMSSFTSYRQAHKSEKKKTYQCNKCDESFQMKDALLEHHRTHAGKKLHQCIKCEKSFSIKVNLLNHERRRHASEHQQTDFKKSVTQKGGPRISIETQKGDLPYQCTKCEKSFSMKVNLVNHERRSHAAVHQQTHCKTSLIQKGGPGIFIETQKGVRPHQCTKCERSFSMKAALANHQRKHTGRKAYQCIECEKTYAQKARFMVHLRRHNEMRKGTDSKKSLFPKSATHPEKKRYQCNKCEKSYSMRAELVNHQKHQKGKGLHVECKEGFIDKGDLMEHFSGHNEKLKRTQCVRSYFQKVGSITHTPKHIYQCSECEKSYIRKTHLVNHERRHREEHCQTESKKNLIQKGHLMVRLRRLDEKVKLAESERSSFQKVSPIKHTPKHEREHPYQCRKCGKGYIRKTHLVNHERRHREEHRQTESKRSFIQERSRMAHLGSHNEKRNLSEFAKSFFQNESPRKLIETQEGEKPYRCTKCVKSFSMKAALVNHQKKHTRQKAYQCIECEKSFLQKGRFMSHLRKHNEKRKGTECEKSFFQKSALLARYRTHAGLNRYQCNECDKSFSMKAHLVNHQRSQIGQNYHREFKKSFS